MEIGLGELLELYEYKVEDLLHGREPKGGRASVRRLRQLILSRAPTGYWGKRFREIDRRYKALQEKAPPSAPPGHSSLDLGVIEIPGEEPPEGASPEKEVLDAFAEDVYWLRLKREMTRTARTLVKGQRYELRLAYAFIQNFEAYAGSETFKRDFNLSRFTPSHPIPAFSDPLAAFDDEEVAAEVLLELFRVAMRLNLTEGYGLQLPAEETVPAPFSPPFDRESGRVGCGAQPARAERGRDPPGARGGAP
ncbi:hypothetical protein [Marinithermus hydrothermalis]|uniref:Uncharacterized protein n=1 Tax=Marinithermus hydrothermalis (strain DSM 14884 / JCM 11576 / T1) TaxID=869210 RepID=F2NNZ0_MARHT|nr:hypothetical protein [Marinithermus hydrothermalis]AEB11578.1 hypothetical protein Marky_0831 [Marinithermus hydrothermalis DSM 14884]